MSWKLTHDPDKPFLFGPTFLPGGRVCSQQPHKILSICFLFSFWGPPFGGSQRPGKGNPKHPPAPLTEAPALKLPMAELRTHLLGVGAHPEPLKPAKDLCGLEEFPFCGIHFQNRVPSEENQKRKRSQNNW